MFGLGFAAWLPRRASSLRVLGLGGSSSRMIRRISSGHSRCAALYVERSGAGK